MEIRSYQLGDEKAILALFHLAFGKKMSEEYWNWRFANNPFSDELFIDLMWDGDKLVGHYAVSPVDMMINGKAEKTALSMTTMTHPEYGGRGIFSQLAESLYRKLSVNNYKLVWGFPNNNSHYGFNKNLSWSDIALQGMMSLNTKNFSRLINAEAKGRSINTTEEIESNLISQLNSSAKYIKINKTKEYLQWRYFDNPTADYKMIIPDDNRGIIIYKVISSFSDSTKSEIDIMDMAFDNDMSVLINLLSSVYNSEQNILQFNLWDSLFSANQIILEKAGFRVCPPVTYLGYRALSSPDQQIADYRSWDISLSYSDVF
ncbi:GNAT family N-acetyltransferase [Flavobacteriaceae bacterium W22]|nr:GNAT family N-acetyltransferase [Flavobacteriaceae bacterium W22]